jgi:hypothetical protein
MVNPKRRSSDDTSMDDVPEWLEAIGPEDLSREEVIENLQEYGFDQMKEGDFVSEPILPSDMPTWLEDPDDVIRNLEDTVNPTHPLTRPVEDEALDNIDDSEDEDIESEI